MRLPAVAMVTAFASGIFARPVSREARERSVASNAAGGCRRRLEAQVLTDRHDLEVRCFRACGDASAVSLHTQTPDHQQANQQ